MNPVEKAAELGREHGVRDAEAWCAEWLDDPTRPSYRSWTLLEAIERGTAHRSLEWPEPDLSGFLPNFHALSEPDTDYCTCTNCQAKRDAYCDAYREARDETIRVQCEEVTQ